MAELPNRDDLEARFARKFGAVARRHMREFEELLGDPPDMDNVPQSFWDKVQREVDSTMYVLLLLIFDDSAEYHGWSGPQANLAAFGWAHKRSAEFSKYWATSTKERLEKAFAKLDQEKRDAEEETIEAARESNRMIPANRTIDRYYEPTKEELKDILFDAFGPKRIEVNAVDETTRARHAGGESAVEETVGISEDDLWRVTEISPGVPDGKVCPLCRSVNRVKRKDWPWRLSEGPPCHPHDRCWVDYALVPVFEAIGRIIDSDSKSLKAFNVSEPRTEDGKWTSSGSGTHPATTIDDLEKRLTGMGVSHWIHEKNGLIKLDKIVVPKENRGTGIGSTAMREIIEYADHTGQRIALSPSTDFGASSRKRLIEFYKQFGFRENKGRSADLSVSESIIRDPEKKSIKSFDLKAWYRTVPEAAEWRAYCIETGTSVDDHLEFCSLFEKIPEEYV